MVFEKKLKRELDKRGIKYTYVSEHLGVSQSYFSQMLNGTRPMNLIYLDRVLELTGIEWEAVKSDYVGRN